MSTSLMTTVSGYAMRLFVARKLGLEALGLYQAGAGLATLYVGTILTAMTADFYPRLTAAAHDNEVCQRLVNEQAEVGLLIAVPGVLVTMGFAPLVIHLFYSGRFEGAVPLLEWQSLGMLLQLLAWPVAFVLLAKGDGRMFFWMELVANLVNLLLIWLGISLFGLVGAGMAYFLFYGIYWWGTYFVVRHRHGFSWSRANLRLWLTLLPATGLVFVVLQYVPRPGSMLLAGAATIVLSAYSIRQLNRALGTSVLSLVWRRFGRLRPRGET